MPVKTQSNLSAVRWGWLLTTLALGATLYVTSWANYRSVRGAVETIRIGQAGVFEALVLGAVSGTHPIDATARLDSLLEEQAGAGLRFVGLVSPDTGPVVLTGDPAGDFQPPRRLRAGPNLTEVGDRVRFFVRLSPGRRGGALPPRSPPPADRAGGGRGDRAPSDAQTRPPPRGPEGGGQPLLVVEYEPLVAVQLTNQAWRSLSVGAIAAALLMLTALFFWQATLHQEAAERTRAEQQRLTTLGEMSAVLAHEIRNPLASLKGHAQLLAERMARDAPDRSRVDRIVHEARRLEALTTDLLDFARTGPLDLREVPVEGLLRESAEGMDEARIEIDASRAPDRWLMDAVRMRQVFSNLFRNAMDASPETTPVHVTAELQGDSLAISIRDQGEGLDDSAAHRIFEPFFTTRTTGTGLGLAVARRIVELHGGTLTARSIAGGGTELRVMLEAHGRLG